MNGKEKFLPQSQLLVEKAGDWQYATSKQERSATPLYGGLEFSRGSEDIKKIHGIDFLNDIIPRLIFNKEKGEKLRILDIGAGAAIFADQVRNTFPEDVIVFSTGLSKKTAKDFRNKSGNAKLHQNDLKWRSITELSDFEEFDLIIDTFGEFNYQVFSKQEFNPKAVKKRFLELLTIVIKKLKPGGIASISPWHTLQETGELGMLEQKYNVSINKVSVVGQKEPVLRVEKMLI